MQLPATSAQRAPQRRAPQRRLLIAAVLATLFGGCTDARSAASAQARAPAPAPAAAAVDAEQAAQRIAPEVLRVRAGQTFAYVIADAADTVIIDSGSDRVGTQLLAALASIGRKPEAVTALLLTHAHADVRAAAAIFPAATVYVSADDFGLLKRERTPGAVVAKLLNRLAGRTTPPALTRLAAAGEILRFGAIEIEVIGTPGHTSGSLSYRYQDILFTGDSLHVAADGLTLAPWYLSDNSRENERSLRRLERVPFTSVADAAGGFTEKGSALFSEWLAAARQR